MRYSIALSLSFLFAISCAPAADDVAVITVVFSNDVHGGIDRTAARFMNDEFPPPLGGGASAAHLISRLRQSAAAAGEGFLLLDAGDFFSGSLFGSHDGGRAVVDYMNAVGYDAVAIGNHEFDQGQDTLTARLRQAAFPVLSANLHSDSARAVLEPLRPYVIREIAGIRLAIIGLTTHGTPAASFPRNVAGLRFDDEVQAARSAIAAARAEGAQFFIGLAHLGLPYDRDDGYARLLDREREGYPGSGAANAMELARRVPEFDAIFTGHIHVGYREPWVDPVTHVPCFQNFGNGTGLGAVKLKVDMKRMALRGWEYFADDGALITLFAEEFSPDPEVDRMISEKAEALAAAYQRTIGRAETVISRSGEGETPLGNLVTDAWREQLGADLALTNTGGLRDDLPAGDITLQSVFDVLPFGNSLVVMVVSGDFFCRLLEEKVSSQRVGFALSGARLTVDLTQPPGEHIREITIGGEPLQPDRAYRLVTTDYLREGNSRFEALASLSDDLVTYTGVLERDALASYIAEKGVLQPLTDGRLQVILSGQP